MIIVKYSHDGSMAVVSESADRSQLGSIYNEKVRQGWDAFWVERGLVFQASREGGGESEVLYALWPDDWPRAAGRPA